jgi:hypothetical protein
MAGPWAGERLFGWWRFWVCARARLGRRGDVHGRGIDFAGNKACVDGARGSEDFIEGLKERGKPMTISKVPPLPAPLLHRMEEREKNPKTEAALIRCGIEPLHRLQASGFAGGR